MLLAIDTATQFSSLALYDGRNLLAEQTWRGGSSHSTQLAPTIAEMLARSESDARELTALAVCVGPGSFTGLRIGVSLAKGMAAARGLPLVGMTTMDILAAAQPQMPGVLVTIVAAGRGRIITGRYQWRKGRWHHRGDMRLMEWDELFDSIDGPAHLTGEINDEGHAALEAAQAKDLPVTLVSGAQRLRRAGWLAQEAWQQVEGRRKADFDPTRVAPVYVRTEGSP